jgi:hypothetical protein
MERSEARAEKRTLLKASGNHIIPWINLVDAAGSMR